MGDTMRNEWPGKNIPVTIAKRISSEEIVIISELFAVPVSQASKPALKLILTVPHRCISRG
jgi:hypothetical protein